MARQLGGGRSPLCHRIVIEPHSCIIAVPTGIASVELAAAIRKAMTTTQASRSCLREGHDADAAFCKFCGVPLDAPSL